MHGCITVPAVIAKSFSVAVVIGDMFIAPRAARSKRAETPSGVLVHAIKPPVVGD